MDKQKYTPMMQQYLEIKEDYADAIVFFRLGDFYEMFFDDAILASKVLEIALTSRDAGAKVPMCGVPHHAVKPYVQKLIEKGFKIAIVEQTTEPGKGLVKREVIRLVTPGTVLEDGILDAKTNNFIASILLTEKGYALTYVDISTGESFITDGLEKKQVLDLILSLDIREIVCPVRFDEDFIRNHFLLANVAHQFQGDERDIVIFSPVISKGVNNNSTTVGFLRTTSNLFNVSITRARSILWVVGDKTRCINAGIKFLKDFVEYIEHERYNNIDLPYKSFQSPWEKRLFEVLVSEGFEPKSQYPTGPYFIDIALFKNGTRLAIEVDGKFWHSTLTGGRLERDIVRDRNLRRMGWKVVRFWVHDLKYDMENCLKIIKEKVNKY